MRLICRSFLLFGVATTLLFTNFSCTGGLAPHNAELAPSIQPWAIDSAYWADENGTPVLLLGAGIDLLRYPAHDQLFMRLNAAGGNYARLDFSTPTPPGAPVLADNKEPSAPLQLNPTYWEYISDLLGAAAGKKIVLHAYGKPATPPGMTAQQLIDHWQPEWQRRAFPYANIIATASSSQVGQPETKQRINDVALAAFEFNRSLLEGAGVADFPRRIQKEADLNAALSAIRAVRTVEKIIPFWTLTPAPEVLLDETSERVVAARDTSGNYLIYVGKPSKIRVRLATEDQLPLRVTVVGYLGTQRSEVLQPPYGSVFELSTEDERGAWLVMRRLPKGS